MRRPRLQASGLQIRGRVPLSRRIWLSFLQMFPFVLKEQKEIKFLM
jgi:hypothetical protein